MDREKKLLKQDLSKLETVEEVEKLREDAELLGHEDIVELANQKLREIENKVQTAETTTEFQISQVNEYGGSNEEIEKRTEGVDQKIEAVKTDTQEKISAVQNENLDEVKTETQENVPEYKVKNKEEVKAEVQEKAAETPSNPEVKSTGMTEAEKEESKKIYEKHQEWEKMREKLRTEYAKSEAQPEYFLFKNDKLNYQKALIRNYEANALIIKSWIQEEKEKKSPNDGFIKTQEIELKGKEEMIEYLKTSTLYTEKQFSDMRDKSGITSPGELVDKYKTDIENSIKEDKYNRNPHKFDKLDGLIDIAKQEKNNDLLNSIKWRNLELPEEIKNKLNN